LQVRDQIDLSQFTVMRHPEDKPGDFLAETLVAGRKVGFDPWLHTASEVETMNKALEPRGVELVPVANLVDAIWTDQPDPPSGAVVAHPDEFAGRSSVDKRAAVALDLESADLSAAVLTLPASIAWLLNVRGSDIARVPVPLAFAILHSDARVDLFTDPSKTAGVDLVAGVRVAPADGFAAGLAALQGRVAVDRDSAPWAVSRAVTAEVVWTRDPCLLPKACKTDAEIAGATAAHLRDGAAMARFLAWLERTAPEGGLTEIDVVTRLEEFRVETGELRDISFETICGSGPNGAIVHYRVTERSNRQVAPGELLLIDSGGQYLDGTTDITRTVAVGPVALEARRPFTLVLKGLIAMTRLVWPVGLAGRDLDAIARSALWAAGLDYDHGTGHGIGAYLDVHEGPQGISRRSAEPLKPGMILSIEPGYYREGAFGIRSENLAHVRAAAVPDGGEREMLGFETLTLAPFDRALIDADLLEPGERAWLDAYHARVAAALVPLVDEQTGRWLARVCAPL
jgi:Xaa-Pro aminopeptidase